MAAVQGGRTGRLRVSRGRSRDVNRDVAEPPSRADGREAFHGSCVGPVPKRGRVGGFYGLRAGRLRPGGAIVPMRIDGRFGLETTHAAGTDAPPEAGRGIRIAEYHPKHSHHAERAPHAPKTAGHAQRA
jgi:hypothetical protein